MSLMTCINIFQTPLYFKEGEEPLYIWWTISWFSGSEEGNNNNDNTKKEQTACSKQLTSAQSS